MRWLPRRTRFSIPQKNRPWIHRNYFHELTKKFCNSRRNRLFHYGSYPVYLSRNTEISTRFASQGRRVSGSAAVSEPKIELGQPVEKVWHLCISSTISNSLTSRRFSNYQFKIDRFFTGISISGIDKFHECTNRLFCNRRLVWADRR